MAVLLYPLIIDEIPTTQVSDVVTQSITSNL